MVMINRIIPEDLLPFKKRSRFLNALSTITVNIGDDHEPSSSRRRLGRQPQPRVDDDVYCPHEHLQAAADCMRMPRLKLYVSKPVTKTDTCQNAHRYQLTCNDVEGVPALTALKRRVVSAGAAANVKVLDKHGNEYDLVFSCMACNGNCRIIGPEWTRFLVDSAMRVGEIMNVYGSCNEEGDFLFALVNT